MPSSSLQGLWLQGIGINSHCTRTCLLDARRFAGGYSTRPFMNRSPLDEPSSIRVGPPGNCRNKAEVILGSFLRYSAKPSCAMEWERTVHGALNITGIRNTVSLRR